MMKNRKKLSHKVIVVMVILASSMGSFAGNGRFKNAAPGCGVEEETMTIANGISQGCPQISRAAIEKVKISERPINRQSFIPVYEEDWLANFDPVSWFYSNPTNASAFSSAYRHAINNREYGVARKVADMTPAPLIRENANFKQVLITSIDGAERREVGYVSFSNRMTKVFQTFPSLTNVFCNPPETFRVEWEESLEYKNKLYLVNQDSGRRVQLLENVVDAHVLWSTNGRYLIIQWRTFRNVRESEALRSQGSKTENGSDPIISVPEKKFKIAVVDTEKPKTVLMLEDYLSEPVLRSDYRKYIVREWTGAGCFLVDVFWGADSKACQELLSVYPVDHKRLKVKVEKTVVQDIDLK